MFILKYRNISIKFNLIGVVMASATPSSVVDIEFKLRSAQAKGYESGNCCSSAKHTALRRKSKDILARSQENVSEWGDVSSRGLLFQ